MQCKISIVVAAGTLLAAIFIGPAFSQVKLPDTQLNLVGSMGIQPATKQIEQPFWSERIPTRSGGALKVKNIPWNELGLKGSEVFHLVRQGVYDGAALVMAFNSGEVAVNDGWDLAGLSPKIEVAREVVDTFFPVVAKHYEASFKIKLLAVWPFPPQVTFCKQELR